MPDLFNKWKYFKSIEMSQIIDTLWLSNLLKADAFWSLKTFRNKLYN